LGFTIATSKLIGSKNPEGLAQFPDEHSQMRCSDNVLLLLELESGPGELFCHNCQ